VIDHLTRLFENLTEANIGNYVGQKDVRIVRKVERFLLTHNKVNKEEESV
jgi:hypothetical protein